MLLMISSGMTNHPYGSDHSTRLVSYTHLLTDLADGYIARRFHRISNLGKILDPVADKLTPVSYTHLDVYKRQVESWSWDCTHQIRPLL